MAQAVNKVHLCQEELSPGDQEKLKTFGKWLSKKETKFTESKQGLQKCVDPQLHEKLRQLLTVVDFIKGDIPSAIAVLRISASEFKRNEPHDPPSHLIPIQINDEHDTPTISDVKLIGRITYIDGSEVTLKGNFDFLSFPVSK